MERTIVWPIRGERSLREEIDRLMVWWCRTMHTDITWPHHGRYQCKSCGRAYAVPWEKLRQNVAPAPIVSIHGVSLRTAMPRFVGAFFRG